MTIRRAMRFAVLAATTVSVLGVSVHAATGHAADATCWLCAICPFC